MLWLIDLVTGSPIVCLTCEPPPTWAVPGKRVELGGDAHTELLVLPGWDRTPFRGGASDDLIAWEGRVWRHPDARWGNDVALAFVCPD